MKPSEILQSIAAKHEVSVADIRSGRRNSRLVAARWDAINAMVNAFPAWSNADIAEVIGMGGPSSVHHAISKTIRQNTNQQPNQEPK